MRAPKIRVVLAALDAQYPAGIPAAGEIVIAPLRAKYARDLRVIVRTRRGPDVELPSGQLRLALADVKTDPRTVARFAAA